MTFVFAKRLFYPAGMRSAPAGLKIFWCPVISVGLSALRRYHAIYTHRIGRIHTLATTSSPHVKWG